MRALLVLSLLVSLVAFAAVQAQAPPPAPPPVTEDWVAVDQCASYYTYNAIAKKWTVWVEIGYEVVAGGTLYLYVQEASSGDWFVHDPLGDAVVGNKRGRLKLEYFVAVGSDLETQLKNGSTTGGTVTVKAKLVPGGNGAAISNTVSLYHEQ